MSSDSPLRLHIGGVTPKDGWKILNIQSGPGVDFVGSCEDLSQFADGSVDEIYASHVYEHLGYFQELPKALSEARRVLRTDGMLKMGVPDLDMLSSIFRDPSVNLQARLHVMRMMLGGQTDAFDFHKCGFSFDIAMFFLTQAGFRNVQRVNSFGLFNDTTELAFLGRPISLNVQAMK